MLEVLLHEKEAKEKLHEARVHDVQARYAAELRAEQLKRELAERTVAWLKERGTLTMRCVLGECFSPHIGQVSYLMNGSSGSQRSVGVLPASCRLFQLAELSISLLHQNQQSIC